MKAVLPRLLSGVLVVSCGGCHWLAGNPDATLNGSVLWFDAEPSPVLSSLELGQTVWVRVRGNDAVGNSVRVLAGRVRQELLQQGWQVTEDRARAAVWLDLDIRYWGLNPARDEAGSTYAKVLRDRRPDLLAEGETARGGRFSPRSILTPAEAIVSSIVANVVEYDLIVDMRVLQRGRRDDTQETQTLVVWVRKIDLEEEEAAIGVGERVLAAIQGVFQRR
jgi:hypothetical protein